eukprot:6840427-Pyramimonas_sp.AAC.1
MLVGGSLSHAPIGLEIPWSGSQPWGQDENPVCEIIFLFLLGFVYVLAHGAQQVPVAFLACLAHLAHVVFLAHATRSAHWAFGAIGPRGAPGPPGTLGARGRRGAPGARGGLAHWAPPGALGAFFGSGARG